MNAIQNSHKRNTNFKLFPRISKEFHDKQELLSLFSYHIFALIASHRLKMYRAQSRVLSKAIENNGKGVEVNETRNRISHRRSI